MNHNSLLEDLFSYVPPRQLRRTIQELFSRYVQTINSETDLEQFKLWAEDLYFLNRFLERIEEGEQQGQE